MSDPGDASPAATEPRFLSVSEFAARTRYSARHIRRLCASGKITEAKRLSEGGNWRIPASEAALEAS